MIAKIIVNGQEHNIDKAFDYEIPQAMEDTAQVGVRVLVPFGRNNKLVEGYIVERAKNSKLKELKRIKEIIDSAPVCSEEGLKLCEWMRERYFCTYHQAIRLMIPPKMTVRVQEWLVLSEDFDLSKTDLVLKSSKTQREVVRFLGSSGGIAEYGEVYEIVKRSNLHRTVYDLRDKGIIEIHQRGIQGIKNKSVRMARLNISPAHAMELTEQIGKRAPIQAAMMNLLCQHDAITTADLVMFTEGSYSAVASLKSKGWISIEQRQVIREAYSEENYKKTEAYVPTAEQKAVIDYINQKANKGEHDKILIRGVTGSGKTEVFLQAIDNCIEKGKKAIVLVPEISLTPQMVERFVSRFGNRVAVIHSALSAGERFDQWNKINSQQVDVVVGARSAVFAPFRDIGIIILDEEHESSYKSEISPKYHAREVAKMRAEHNNAVLVLASATPSVESYYSATIGEYKLFHMDKRYNENRLPQVQVVDMRAELINKHNTSVFSELLRNEIQKNLNNKEKTILFLNRRGYSTFVSCRECGYVITCNDCSISLTYHRSGNSLTCHYCGYSQTNVSNCPQCGSRYIKFFGTGTQKVEEEIRKFFPYARVLRMDIDTTSGKGGHESVLRKFGEGNTDILIGTQMVTKGLDFPFVTLVGVLAADTSLNLDDFRANERTFSLLTQVSGRAGRGEILGRAVVQTYQPDNYTIKLAKNHDYLAFFEDEIKMREKLEYPPFCDIVCIILSGPNEEEVDENIKKIDKILRESQKKCEDIIQILGPVAAPVAKIKKKFRYRIIIKCKSSESVAPILREILAKHEKMKGDTNLSVDINPNNMY